MLIFDTERRLLPGLLICIFSAQRGLYFCLSVVGAFSVRLGQLPCDRCSLNGGHVRELYQCYSGGRCTSGRWSLNKCNEFMHKCMNEIPKTRILTKISMSGHKHLSVELLFASPGAVGLVCVRGAVLSALGGEGAL